MTKHTPGPWELEAGRSFVTPSGTFHLAYGRDKHGNPNFRNFVELDRNARLIAAAPDMLAALISVVDFLDDGTPDSDRSTLEIEVLKEVCAAIAKAKGE